jgi:hypothetical protein
MGSRLPALSACRARVVVGLAALALLAAFPARAQPATADLPGAPAATLLAVVLSTAADTSRRPSATLPESLRDKSLYWRRLKSGDAVSYQLCLGFFGTRSDAERARQQLAPGFPEARVISVSPRESANVLQARQGARPAPVAAPPPPPAPESEWSRWK